MTDVDEIYREIESFIGLNYHLPITIDSFTQARVISRGDALAALSFHATSWARLLLDARMRCARDMLGFSDESVLVIAIMCGYPDQAQFIRTFKAEEGKEPEEYRQWMTHQQQPASPQDGSPSS